MVSRENLGRDCIGIEFLTTGVHKRSNLRELAVENKKIARGQDTCLPCSTVTTWWAAEEVCSEDHRAGELGKEAAGAVAG